MVGEGVEHDDWMVTQDLSQQEVRILLVDPDPISRHVFATVLRAHSQLRVVDCLDSRLPAGRWPLHEVDVVVMASGEVDECLGTVRELAPLKIKMLLISIGWTRHGLTEALAAGATGFLVKDTGVRQLPAAITAVASGHLVFSPGLLRLFAAPPVAGSGQQPASAASDRSANEVLLRSLTDREQAVLALLADGLSTTEAAQALNVSTTTIKSHISHFLAKLGARNRLEAVLLRQGVLDSAAADQIGTG